MLSIGGRRAMEADNASSGGAGNGERGDHAKRVGAMGNRPAAGCWRPSSGRTRAGSAVRRGQRCPGMSIVVFQLPRLGLAPSTLRRVAAVRFVRTTLSGTAHGRVPHLISHPHPTIHCLEKKPTWYSRLKHSSNPIEWSDRKETCP